jgi:cystathionine beta-lyase/cystathionine gamma-synthase|tara:strand:- start:2261 stop:3409 length:1149 start_codon:yes stop_codon:yes gene_type:complete
MNVKSGKNTICVHAGGLDDENWKGLSSPVISSTSYRYRETVSRGYPRYFQSPNQKAVIDKLCALEKTEDGLLFSSGMAAISSTILSLVKTGQHIVVQSEVYGGTSALFIDICAPLKIEFSFVNSSVEAIVEAIRNDTVLIFIECPTNPTLATLDIATLTKSISGKNITTVIDNTFATPINQNPSQLGIDIVVHSGTKFLSGHSDLCCGVILGKKVYIAQIRQTAKSLGGSLNATDCYLLERSLKTLNLRVQKQTANAQKIAELLSNHKSVKQVHYPGLPSNQYHEIAKLQMSGFGSMIAFSLSDQCNPDVFMSSLKIIITASSLGGVETIISQPWFASHQAMPEAQKIALGIDRDLFRLSVGIEDIEDLLDDIQLGIEASEK